jgi:hypothetical protein
MARYLCDSARFACGPRPVIWNQLPACIYSLTRSPLFRSRSITNSSLRCVCVLSVTAREWSCYNVTYRASATFLRPPTIADLLVRRIIFRGGLNAIVVCDLETLRFDANWPNVMGVCVCYSVGLTSHCFYGSIIDNLRLDLYPDKCPFSVPGKPAALMSITIYVLLRRCFPVCTVGELSHNENA